MFCFLVFFLQMSLVFFVFLLIFQGFSGFARLSGVIRANRKFEWFVRIGLKRYKNRGFNCEWFARIALRIARATKGSPGERSPCPLVFLRFSLVFSKKEIRNEGQGILPRSGRGTGTVGTIFREVLHGVGADGVRMKFPIFAVNCCCLPLAFRKKKGENA